MAPGRSKRGASVRGDGGDPDRHGWPRRGRACVLLRCAEVGLAHPALRCATGMLTRCQRRRSACRGRRTCTETSCVSWAGRHEAVHPIKFAPREGLTLASRRAALVAALSGKRGQRYQRRQQLLDMGEPALPYLTEIVPRRPVAMGGEVDRCTRSCRAAVRRFYGGAMEGGLKEEGTHFNVTAHPTSETRLPVGQCSRYLLHEAIRSMGIPFVKVRGMGMTEALTSPRSPCQNPYAGRLVGSIRCECLYHIVIFNQGPRDDFSNPNSIITGVRALTWGSAKTSRVVSQSASRARSGD